MRLVDALEAIIDDLLESTRMSSVLGTLGT